MVSLSMNIRIDKNDLVIELIENGDQGGYIVCVGSITRQKLKEFLDNDKEK